MQSSRERPVVNFGGGETGAETAEYLRANGNHVLLVTSLSRKNIVKNADRSYRRRLHERLAANPLFQISGHSLVVACRTTHSQRLTKFWGSRGDPSLRAGDIARTALASMIDQSEKDSPRCSSLCLILDTASMASPTLSEIAMASSINPDLDGPRISYSFSFKDSDGDGAVSFAEYVTPVPTGATAITPADVSGSPSMEETFKFYDANHDGKVSEDEQINGGLSTQVGGPNVLNSKLGYVDAVMSYYKGRDAKGESEALVRALSNQDFQPEKDQPLGA